MIDEAHNPRDKALFAVQFEAGLRSGELFGLRVGDVFDSKHTVGHSVFSLRLSASKKATRNPPTKRVALVGGAVGICIGLSSHFLLLDYSVVSVTICLLYSIGVTLIIDYVSILRQTPYDGGSWWTIAFGATTGLVLMVVQLVYHPIVPDKIAVKRGVLPEGVRAIPFNLILILWLLMFGVALVSLTYGIGMAVTDMSEG